MTPPRFRAWHPVRKEMCKVTGLHWFEGEQLLEISVDTVDGEIQCDHASLYKIMQSTGHVDIVGKEMFDEDVVEMEGAKAVVRWDDCGAAFYFDVIDQDEWCDDWNFGDDSHRSLKIGNIYENPELLTPKL